VKLNMSIKEKVLGLFRRYRWRAVAVAVAAVVVLVVAVVLVVKNLPTPEEAMASRLEKYSKNVYEKELRDKQSDSYTVTLTYLERKGYDMSIFDKNGCDKTGSFAIISVNKDKDITDIKPQLKCSKK